MKKRMLAVLLALCMTLTLLPGPALAAEGDSPDTTGAPTETVGTEESVANPSEDETAAPTEGTEAPDGAAPEDVPNDAAPEDVPNDVTPEEIPGTEPTGEADNANAGGPVEWTYAPTEVLPLLAVDGVMATADATLTQIQVTNGKETPVEGATVELKLVEKQDDGKINQKLVKTFQTNADGLAYDGDPSVPGIQLDKYVTAAQRPSATISAKKVVAREQITAGDGRTPLMSQFTGGTRWEKELHSEWIDLDGNWQGEPIPMVGGDKADIVFVIDTTGSMGDDITNVCNNISAFAKILDGRGLDYQFSFISYRDIKIKEETELYKDAAGKFWFTGLDDVTTALSGIAKSVSGGGDGPETPIDGLGYAIHDLKNWRTDANKFAFLITDADFHVDNNYDYASLNAVTAALQARAITTSVITATSYQSKYQYLYSVTGGKFGDLRGNFSTVMAELAEAVSAGSTGDMTLSLTEPRMLLNMATSYMDNGEEGYENKIQNMLREYAHRMAEATDGHVLINEMLLIPTTNRMDFYNTSLYASMADFRIESAVNEEFVRIHSNAHVGGYNYSGLNAIYDETGSGGWQYGLPEGLADNRTTFYRIWMSGVEGAGWEHSLAKSDEVYEYSTTVMHESGHYVLGLWDEYLDADDKPWPDDDTRHLYGLMDNNHTDIELSQAATDYAVAINQPTAQSSKNGMSAEDHVARLLETDLISPVYSNSLKPTGTDGNTYDIHYTKAAESRKDVTEGDGDRKTDNYPVVDEKLSFKPITDRAVRAAGEGLKETSVSIADVSWSAAGSTVTMTLAPKAGHTPTEVIYTALGGKENTAAITDNTATLTVGSTGLVEVKVVEGTSYNVYYIDQYNTGAFYESLTGGVQAYVKDGGATFIGDSYLTAKNGDLYGVNEATYINAKGEGEIYSVVSCGDYVDYTTLAWYKSEDNGATWTKVAGGSAERINNENITFGVVAPVTSGEAIYVLMAKDAAPATTNAPVISDVTSSTTRDGFVSFKVSYSGAETVDYFNVYYAASGDINPATNPDVFSKRLIANADGTYTLNLLDHGREVIASVEAVFTDGSRSSLSVPTNLTGGTAYTNGSKIPDWFYNWYLMWRKDGLPVDDLDEDGDGYTNLEEFEKGLNPYDPTDGPGLPDNPDKPDKPDDPFVDPDAVSAYITILDSNDGSIIPSTRHAEPGERVNLYIHPNEGYELDTLTITDRRGRHISYRSLGDDAYSFFMPAAPVTVEATFNAIKETPAPGTTDDPAEQEFNGLGTPGISGIVLNPAAMPYTDVKGPDWFYNHVEYMWKHYLMSGVSDTQFAPNLTTNRGMIWTILARMNNVRTDINPGSTWYEKGLLWCREQGITDGSNPMGDITREQLVTMLWRNSGKQGGTGDLSQFSDSADVSEYAVTAMRWAVGNGILNGENGKINPKGTATRAQVAAMVARYGDKIVR